MFTKEPGKSRAGGRPRAFDRDAALETAMRLFWRHGYEGASIADLTGALGIAPPSLYAAFSSKAALYAEALDRYAGLASGIRIEILGEAPSLREGVARLLDRGAEAMTSPDRQRGCMVTTALVSGRPADRRVAEDLRRRRREMLESMAAALGRHVPPDRAAAVARYLMTVLQGLALQARDGATSAELEEAAAVAVRAFDGPDA